MPIKGITVQLTTGQLRAILTEKAASHRKKADSYKDEISRLEDIGMDRTGHSMDPLRDIEQRSKSHAEKAEYFEFVAEHLVGGEIYMLDNNDLRTLEIAAPHY